MHLRTRLPGYPSASAREQPSQGMLNTARPDATTALLDVRVGCRCKDDDRSCIKIKFSSQVGSGAIEAAARQTYMQEAHPGRLHRPELHTIANPVSRCSFHLSRVARIAGLSLSEVIR